MEGSGQQLRPTSRVRLCVIAVLSGLIALAAVGAIVLIVLQIGLGMFPDSGSMMLGILAIPGVVVAAKLTISLMNFYERSTGTTLRSRMPRIDRN